LHLIRYRQNETACFNYAKKPPVMIDELGIEFAAEYRRFHVYPKWLHRVLSVSTLHYTPSGPACQGKWNEGPRPFFIAGLANSPLARRRLLEVALAGPESSHGRGR
jgi:hypothetical protein